MAKSSGRGCRAILLMLSALLVVVSIATAAGLWAWRDYLAFQATPLSGLPRDATVQVRAGDSFHGVLARLRAVGVHEGHDLQWQLLARQLDAAGKLKVGEYALAPRATPRSLLLDMRQGRVIQYRFTIVEGWNIRQLRAALAQASPLVHRIDAMDDAALMAALGHPGRHPEGRFLPETYLYGRGDTDLDLLRRAQDSLDKALAQAWATRAPDLPLASPEQALTLASIVEKETAIAEERPQIAGVFVRRLRLGMRLQTDPTVIYGLGSGYDGNIRKRDLLADTPYNTYTRTGLTPTPIAMPGRAALQAATHPAQGDALYFVALGDGSGRHVFSDTLAGHNAAVARYLQQLRQTSSAQAPGQADAPAPAQPSARDWPPR